MVTPTDIVGVFLFSRFRFPASTWNIKRGFVHVLCPYGCLPYGRVTSRLEELMQASFFSRLIGTLQESFCLVARRIIKL